MTAAILTAGIALALVVAVAWPVVAGRSAGAEESADDAERRELDDRIAASLQAVREIAFDHRAGNLSDDDFAELDRAERANAARLLRRRDELDRVS